MFGDPAANPRKFPVASLSGVMSLEPQNGLYKPQSYYVDDESGTPILRIDAFYDGAITDHSSLKRLVCTEAEKEKYKLRENDIVINRVNGSIEFVGKCAHIVGLVEETVFESNMMRFHPDEEKLNPVFLVQVLCSQFIRQQIKGTAKMANQCSINQTDVSNFRIPLPPKTEQDRFADFVRQADKSKFEIQQGLEQLELQYNALMQKYFG
jgi:type I restriction enzyme S subunit